MTEMGEKSRMASYGSLEYNAGLAPCVLLLLTVSVYPSGAELTASSVAIELLAPGRLSMTNCWPSLVDSHWPSRRALMSPA